jgi:hypothetical protein
MTAQWLQTRTDDWLQGDDVFTPTFLAGVLFEVNAQEIATLSTDIQIWLKESGTASHGFITKEAEESPSKQGVYIVDNGYLREVLRLYDDTHNAYISSMRSNTKGR